MDAEAASNVRFLALQTKETDVEPSQARYPRDMCAQCMMGAVTAAGAATGARSYLATRAWAWLTPRRMRRITAGLLGSALVASAVLLG